jgi:hypothetical protein
MSAYIDRTFVETLLGTNELDILLGYGGITGSVAKQAKFDQLVSMSSGIVDGYIYPAYDMPLDAVGYTIKTITYFTFKNFLYNESGRELKDFEREVMNSQIGMLQELKNKHITLPDVDQNTSTGIGGSIFYVSSSNGTSNGTFGIMGANQTRGYFW